MARIAGLFAFLGLILAVPVHAENVLEDLTYTAQPGGRVEITMRFSEPVAVPQAFTTESPPRIALDLADTRSALSTARIEVGCWRHRRHLDRRSSGSHARSSSTCSDQPATKHASTARSSILSIGANIGGSNMAATAAANKNPTKTLASQSVELSNVDFRRGKTGEGRIVVSFSGPGAAADLKREGDKVVLDILNVNLPPNLAQRLDVLDFATPVQYIETRSRGAGVRIDITAQGPFEQLAYQTGSEYVVEISPKREDEKLKKNAEPVFNGSRVTFNFQDIPTRSVLQLIADVSDLNIVVADSVQGNVTSASDQCALGPGPAYRPAGKGTRSAQAGQRHLGRSAEGNCGSRAGHRRRAPADGRQGRTGLGLHSDQLWQCQGHCRAADQGSNELHTGAAGGRAAGATQQRGFLSQRGTVSYDDRTNTLLVSDTPQKVLEIRQLIAVLDRPVQQVLIESRIVIATDTFARELGVKFGISGGYEDKNGNVVSTAGTATGTDRMSNLALNNRFNGGRGLPVFNPGTIPTTSSAERAAVSRCQT